jgi:hypothetical protein
VLQPDVVVGNASLWVVLGRAPTLRVFTRVPLVEGAGAVAKAGAVVSSITTEYPAGGGGGGGTAVWAADQFIDASYEGDLAVAAGVAHTYGREGAAQYGEPLAGVQPYNAFQNFWGPGLAPRDGGGALLPYISNETLPPPGSPDTKVMPFSYRACLTRNTSNALPFPAPPAYAASDFALLGAYVRSFNASARPNGPTINDLVGAYKYGGPVPYPRGGVGMNYDLCEGGRRDRGQTCPVTTDQPDINDGWVTAGRAPRGGSRARALLRAGCALRACTCLPRTAVTCLCVCVCVACVHVCVCLCV